MVVSVGLPSVDVLVINLIDEWGFDNIMDATLIIICTAIAACHHESSRIRWNAVLVLI
jgi:hypothetical protein